MAVETEFLDYSEDKLRTIREALAAARAAFNKTLARKPGEPFTVEQLAALDEEMENALVILAARAEGEGGEQAARVTFRKGERPDGSTGWLAGAEAVGVPPVFLTLLLHMTLNDLKSDLEDDE